MKRTLPMGQAETYAYDSAGNLQSRTDFNGKTTVYAYDNMRRLLSETPDASLNQAGVTYTYNTLGQRETMTDASGMTTYTYDARNRLKTRATPEGTLTYTYDNAGNRKTMRSSNPNGVTVGYAYDVLNRLSTVTDNRLPVGANQTIYSYDVVGNLQSYLYPNGVQATYAYNSLNRLTDLTSNRGATQLVSYAYTLGAAGNRLSVTEQSGRTVTYTYDALYRLKNEIVTNDPNATNNGTVEYSYDAVGNRLSRTSTLSSVPSATSTYDANDRLESDQYDANGNTKGANGNTYSFDWENHLTSVNNGSVSYVYDGDGNRVGKTISGVTTRYLVDANNPTGYAQVADELTGGQVTRTYTYGHDLISENQIINGDWSVSYYGYDGYGSTRFLTNSAGTVTDTYTYDAFGNLINQAGATPNEYLYSGEQFDSNLGFYYLRARYLNPGPGRFWTMDSYEGCRCNPQSQNKYTYGHDNPVNNIDPSGNSIGLADSAAVLIGIGILATIASLNITSVKNEVEKELKKIKECKDGVGNVFYRAMTEDSDGLPLVKEPATSNTLGARAGTDIPVVNGMVEPDTKGMSVTPFSVMRLRDRLPKSLGGEGNKPAFCLNLVYLPPELKIRLDPDAPEVHAFVEPNHRMSFDDYERYITSTRPFWIKVANAF